MEASGLSALAALDDSYDARPTTKTTVEEYHDRNN
jgi:hypothetical protein